MRQEKQLLLDEIKTKIDASEAFIVARYQQLRAPKLSEFRQLMVKNGGDFEVVRKRIFLKAINASTISFDATQFEGHIGVLFAQKNSLELTKVIYDFIKSNGETLQVLAGKFDGKIYTATDIEKLSKLPSLSEMHAQFLGLLEAPMAQTLAVMDALLTSILHCLENKSKKDSE